MPIASGPLLGREGGQEQRPAWSGSIIAAAGRLQDPGGDQERRREGGDGAERRGGGEEQQAGEEDALAADRGRPCGPAGTSSAAKTIA